MQSIENAEKSNLIQHMFDFDNTKIGIIGLGFVGNAVYESFEGFHRIVVDIDPHKSTGSYNDIKKCDVVFICVPSPANTDGTCNGSILESVLNNLVDYDNLIISKVTATPDIYENLQKKFNNLVYIPEFLTAANAYVDYMAAEHFIIGGQITAFKKEAERILRYTHKNAIFYPTDIKTASMIKYIINSFLATKVVFMNEMASLAESQGISWVNVARLLTLDTRIGESHMQVPGPDGFNGFGGMCFPKDTSALLKYAEQNSQKLNVLNEAVNKNTLLRLTKPK